MATLVMLHEPHPWLNVIEYPFYTRHHATREGWMSYVDEGRGRPIVFVHGSPLWSFCWRKLIRTFSSKYRCVAPDLLGFGLSEKPEDADYSPPAHMRRLSSLLDELELDDVTLVVHDFGGPIGLHWALENPGRVREIVIFNSWMWSLSEDRVARHLYRLFGSRLNRWYYRVLPAGPSFFLPVLFADRYRVPRFTREQYLMPFVRQKERQGPYTAAEDLIRYSGYYDDLWSRVDELRHFPTLLVWGMEDLSLGEEAIQRWKSAIPEARASRLHRAARYAMDDAPLATEEAFRHFLS
jgi:haloalkane dehalogenase